MTASKPLVLVDGSSYLYRAFHVPNLSRLSTRAGEPTGALYGVLNMVNKLIEEIHPQLMAVVFDAPGKTFRHKRFADYKAHRPPMPPELAGQIEPLHRAIRALGLPLLCESGVEADDVIGTLTRQARQQDLPVLIVTGDKDLAQLVDGGVKLRDTLKDTLLDARGVEEKFGVPPERIVDLLALTGDSSDNIPGIPGVGPKTAVKWLKEYQSLDKIVANADRIKGKVGERLRENLEALELSRQLVTLDCHVSLEYSPNDLKPGQPDRSVLKEIYRRYELHSLLQRLEDDREKANRASASRNQQQAGGREYETVLDRERFETWIKRLEGAELFAFDTETDSLDYLQAAIVGVSFAVESHRAAYVPLGHSYPGAPDQLDRNQILERLRPLLEDPRRGKVGQNLKFDLHVLRRADIELAGIRHDTMLESYVWDSSATRHDMDSLARLYLGEDTVRFEDVAGKGAKMLTFDQVPLEQAGPYAAEDADITLRLHHTLWGKLSAIQPLADLYRTIELPLVPVLARMEHTGVRVDVEALRKQSQEIAKRLLEIEERAHAEAGQPFNLGSTKQLQEILYERLGLPVTRKTPKGAPSTAEDVLQELALDYPLPKLILEHRGLAKLRSTYTDKLPQQIHSNTGRVHTSYHQAVAVTGRLSSSDPNLQNIPIRSPEGRRIRQAFIPEPDYKILAADYSQVELRIMAHLSGDEGLLGAFEQGEDIHRATAGEIFDLPLELVGGEQRRAAKAINFGLIYGMSAFGLARQLGIERGRAQDYVERYFSRYPAVRDYMERTRRQAREQGFVETVYGRRLYLPDIKSSNNPRRQGAERAAINAPMQGTAADIIKLAMIAVDHWLMQSRPPVRMIMQVHDELVFEVREDFIDQASGKIRQLMAGAAQLTVPLEVDIGVGDNWDEAH